jgi:hypothetical protein
MRGRRLEKTGSGRKFKGSDPLYSARISMKAGKSKDACSHQLQLACIHSKSFLTPFLQII